MGNFNILACLKVYFNLSRDAISKICLINMRILRIFKGIMCLICFSTVLSCIVIFVDSKIKNKKIALPSYSPRALPTNNPTGLLRIYNHQRLKHSNASFVPEVYSHHIIIRLRLQQFIDIKQEKFNSTQNITIECFSILRNISYDQTESFLTTHLSVSLFPRIIVSVLFIKNCTEHSHTRQIIKNLTDPFVVYLPIAVEEETSYKFSFRTETKNETFFEWPSWPLSLECIQQYKKKIKKIKKDVYFSLPCCLTDEVKALTSQQIFDIERKSLSNWLDVQYQVGDIRPVVSNRKLYPFERAANNTTCPSEFQKWVADYHTWHTKTSRSISRVDLAFAQRRDIIQKLNVRFILLESFGSGLADRITHFIATYLVALLTNRLLLFDDTWPEFHEIMQSSLDYRAEIITPWIFYLNEVNANISSDDPRFFSVKSLITRIDRVYRVFDYENDFPERILLIKSHTGNVMHTLTAPTSIYSEFLTKKLRMRPDNLFGCLYHSLIIPKLSTLIDVCSAVNDSTQYMLKALMLPEYPTVGIQIRIGDSHMEIKDHYSPDGHQLLVKHMSFFECAQNLSNGRVPPLVYLISDSRDLRWAALSNWPHPANDSIRIQVIANTRPAMHITYASHKLSALRFAILETFLFSLCDTHIITTDSGFGRFSAFSSLNDEPLYSFNAEDKPICSHGEGQVTFVRAGHQWSGVR